MSYVRICDTCTRSRIELDTEDPTSVELPEGWTTDEFERDHCDLCNLEAEQLESTEATAEDLKPFEKELKKETKKLNKAAREAKRALKQAKKEADNVE